MTTTTVVLGCIVCCMAGLASGLTSFGCALVAVPLLTLFLPPRTVVPLVLFITNVSHAIVLADTWKLVELKRIWLLVVCGGISTALGTYLLLILDGSVLKLGVGSIIVLSAVALLLGFDRPLRHQKASLASIGILSGLRSGATGMGGPPVVLFYTNQRVEKRVFRANLNAYFTVLALSTLPWQLAGGLITKSVVLYAVLFLPALVLGTGLGILLLPRVEQKTFRSVVPNIAMLSGTLSILSGFGLL